MTEHNFDDIRPYHDSEINAAMKRLTADPALNAVASFVYPDVPVEHLQKMIQQISTITDFQVNIMHRAIYQIIKKTISQFSYSGFENLDPSKNYLFISNHRDILLDSGLFQLALVDNGFSTSEIAFGSNLLYSQFVVDIAKSNKLFKVERGGNTRDMYHNSVILSKYIRQTITSKNDSIWIAQRNGRTKDGNDSTDQGLLKMFDMSSNGSIIDSLSELNIVPLSISYQWETCDAMKMLELYVSKTDKYVKAPGEDLKSILSGIKQFKGNVHIEITEPITNSHLQQFKDYDKNELFSSIAKLIDNRIHSHYQLWDNNYIAYDIENNTIDYLKDKYTLESRMFFIQEMEKKIYAVEGNKEELKKIYLGIYSNPLKNALKIANPIYQTRPVILANTAN
ncbi:MAG: acyltransferase [Salinivirgaceae bacterium]